MKNIEKYEKEITERVNNGLYLDCSIAHVAGIENGDICVLECSKCHKRLVEWMYSEYKEPILNDKEKEIIKKAVSLISDFGATVTGVRKNLYYNKGVFVNFMYNDILGHTDLSSSPLFDGQKMFEGMETGKEYTLDELGL